MSELTISCVGRTALITGSTGNLGRTMAKQLSKAGASVALHGFSRPEALEELADEIRSKGGSCCTVTGAVNDPSAIASMVKCIERELGPVDILVLNAVSQIQPWRSVLEESEQRLQDQFDTCSLQALHMTQAFVPAMIERKWGRVIGISTECATQLFPKQGAYASAKRGMDGLLRVLVNEVGEHGVTVNQVAPGWIDSGEEPDLSAGSKDYIRRVSPMGRRADAGDVANCVAFLASDLAKSMTGGWIPVSCGSVSPRI